MAMVSCHSKTYLKYRVTAANPGCRLLGVGVSVTASVCQCHSGCL